MRVESAGVSEIVVLILKLFNGAGLCLAPRQFLPPPPLRPFPSPSPSRASRANRLNGILKYADGSDSVLLDV